MTEDTLSNAWFDATLRLPRIGGLSDDEMRTHFPMMDGRWSAQTQDIITRHHARGLTLNANWALVRTWWACPSCLRNKQAVARLSPTGILLACLEAHHDHLREWCGRAFRSRLGSPPAYPVEAFHVETAAKDLVERFERELICQDCNAADGQAKIQLKGEIDPDFSFAPHEIKQFVRIRTNAAHEIDFERALAIWQSCRSDFESRKQFALELIARIANGELRRARTGAELRTADLWLRPGYLLGEAFAKAMTLHPDSGWENRSYWDFLARSTSNEGAGTNFTKRKKFAPRVPPTDAEYTALNSDIGRTTKPFRNASEDWRCACCGRLKREICRKSNAGQWIGRISHHLEYLLESDPTARELRRSLYPAFIPDPIVSKAVRTTLCHDCAGISAQLKAERREISNRVYLAIEDLRTVITAVAPHASHERDMSIAADCAQANAELVLAIDAFHEHRNLALGVHVRYRLAREWGFSDGKARAYAAMEVEETRGLLEGRLGPFLDWLLYEAARLDEKHTSSAELWNEE
jgi:hypothetical protein